MNGILYFFRDSITGIYYFIYAFICLLLMFSIIGYLFKQKYAKLEIKLNTSQPGIKEEPELSRKEKKKMERENKQKEDLIQNTNQTQVPNQQNLNQQVSSISTRPLIEPTLNEKNVLNNSINQSVNNIVSNNNLNQESQPIVLNNQEKIDEI